METGHFFSEIVDADQMAADVEVFRMLFACPTWADFLNSLSLHGSVAHCNYCAGPFVNYCFICSLDRSGTE